MPGDPELHRSIDTRSNIYIYILKCNWERMEQGVTKKENTCSANFPRVNKESTHVNSFYFVLKGAHMSDTHIPQGGRSVGSVSLWARG